MFVQRCQAPSMSFAAGAVCVWVQVKLWLWMWVCGPDQDTTESALPGERSAREEPCTQPATGLPQPAGGPHAHTYMYKKMYNYTVYIYKYMHTHTIHTQVLKRKAKTVSVIGYFHTVC